MGKDLVTILRLASDPTEADSIFRDAADRIQALEEALAPFARVMNILEQWEYDDTDVKSVMTRELKRNDFRRARAELAKREDK